MACTSKCAPKYQLRHSDERARRIVRVKIAFVYRIESVVEAQVAAVNGHRHHIIHAKTGTFDGGLDRIEHKLRFERRILRHLS